MATPIAARVSGHKTWQSLQRYSQIKTMKDDYENWTWWPAIENWQKLARSEAEPIEGGEGFTAFETPQRYERLVWRALGEELISPFGPAQMLGLPLDIIEREIRGPREH